MRLFATHEEPRLETGTRVLISRLVAGLVTLIGVVIGGMQAFTQPTRRVQSPDHRPAGHAGQLSASGGALACAYRRRKLAITDGRTGR